MNLGYEGAVSKEIKSEDESDRHHISLYIKLIESALSNNTNAGRISALEIGCGRGGGCYVMKNYFNIADITAVDLSSANIRLAKRFLPEGKFFASDAIAFHTDKKFDLIVNLESSHRYSSRLLFFKNVVSMMKPDARFAFGDMIRKNELEDVEKMFQESGLQIISTQTVNKEVVASIEKNSRKQYPLATKFPGLFPRRIHSFFVTIHSRAYNRLKNGEVLYNLYVLKKN